MVASEKDRLAGLVESDAEAEDGLFVLAATAKDSYTDAFLEGTKITLTHSEDASINLTETTNPQGQIYEMT